MLPSLVQAAQIAIPNNDSDLRKFWLGAVGIRDDGVTVSAKNGAITYSTSVEYYNLNPHSHAEGRLLRKLGKNGVVYVARVSKGDGNMAMARPCHMCQIRLRSAKVKKVYYTINNSQYGVWYPESDTDRVYTV